MLFALVLLLLGGVGALFSARALIGAYRNGAVKTVVGTATRKLNPGIFWFRVGMLVLYLLTGLFVFTNGVLRLQGHPMLFSN
jgi:hypothetical protein